MKVKAKVPVGKKAGVNRENFIVIARAYFQMSVFESRERMMLLIYEILQ